MAGFNILKAFEKREAVNNDFSPFRSFNEVMKAVEYSPVSAIENSAVFTAIRTIAGDISALPIKVKDSKYDYNEELEYLLNVEPNSVMTGKDLKYILIANAILNGNSYAEIERDSNGVPVALHHITNDKVVNIKKKSTTKYLVELEYEVQKIGKGSGNRKVNGEDMIHIKPFTLDGLIGKSPLIALKEEIETEKHSKRFFTNFFKNGTQAGSILNVQGNLNADDKEVIREKWQEANAGSDNAHKVIVLDDGTSYEPIKVDTEILKLINESKHSDVKVAQVLGVPLHKMKIETHSMSLEQANSDYVINTLNDYISSFESELNRKLFNVKAMRQENKISFNTDVYKYVDAKTKREIVKADWEMGLIDLNEAREEIGKPPVEGGDRRIQSLNYMNVDLIDEYQLKRVDSVQNNTVDEATLEGGENDE
ncbi:phage portal protein [Salinicoccus halitifaciens]|uniref:HK97 family phage portal protein n=1 Tax=Salinicoccus halitifaciens TaxID=1073415 RepID=A0ABV2E5S2_9STAP|nr:phage portal protein [Salinicoccus halitifaciens]MCD2137177.1 phage portal protein [Salinicoccus halitifaciens]